VNLIWCRITRVLPKLIINEQYSVIILQIVLRGVRMVSLTMFSAVHCCFLVVVAADIKRCVTVCQWNMELRVSFWSTPFDAASNVYRRTKQKNRFALRLLASSSVRNKVQAYTLLFSAIGVSSVCRARKSWEQIYFGVFLCRAVASGKASGVQPPIWNRCPPFHVWPTGCCIHPILYLKNVVRPSGFWPLLLVFGPPCC